jgi:uncharacterized tellurite resistance protein B-like protein
MFERLRALFDGATSTGTNRRPDDLHSAAAALLAVTARLDGDFSASERQAVTQILQIRFGLPADAAADLLRRADTVASEATDLFTLTQPIKRSVDIDRRVEVLEMLWEVTYADGVLHDYEANLVRRAAGLLHVSDQESGAARIRVMHRLGLKTASTP